MDTQLELRIFYIFVMLDGFLQLVICGLMNNSSVKNQNEMREQNICHTRFNIIIKPPLLIVIQIWLRFSHAFLPCHTFSPADGKNNHIISAESLLLTCVELHYSYRLESGNNRDNVLERIKRDGALCGQVI